ncbi:MAG: hypothetical protein GVY29_08485, partial [Spirochaetes bacterium]|nr:hypothetical protein [Spirochaetota bacterium]
MASTNVSTVQGMESKRYRAFDLSVSQIGKDKLLIRSRRSGNAAIFTSSQARMLLRCNSFKTLSDHVSTLRREIKNDHTEDTNSLRAKIMRWAIRIAQENDFEIPVRSEELETLKDQFSLFVKDGFLISEADVHSEIFELISQPSSRTESSNLISTIGIATSNRTKHLEHALESYIENSKRHRRNPSFVIVDDSEEEDMCEETRRVLRRSRERYDAEILYADRERRALFADKLARRAALPLEITRFALLGDKRFGMTYGAAVNTLLLHGIGDLILVVDDDTVCKPVMPPKSSLALALTSRADPNEYWFFETRGAALGAGTSADDDLLGLHQELLGRTLRSCISEAYGDGMDIGDMSPRFLEKLHQPGAKVGATFCGTVGDPGSEATIHRLFSTDTTFHRLTHSPRQYSSKLTTHEVLK